MASSDDEGETYPDVVSDYYFADGDNEPLSFSKLPVQWNESESSSTIEGPIFMSGSFDNGLRKFYQQVKAWKFDLSSATPEISVLSKDNHWIKLQKPRKSYIPLVRTILITIHSLCFLRRKPEASAQSLWDHLSKVFSLYDVRPSENDLRDHISFIKEVIKKDEALAKSKFLTSFLENPRKKKSSDEDVGTGTKPSFIVDDTDELQEDDFITKQTEDSDSDEDDYTDLVCAICDEGGSLICCDGKCFRSFHANRDFEEAEDSNCETLCINSQTLEAQDQFKCENCQYSLHQCFVCGELGSSDKSSNTEVFQCSSATCGHFYHPQCVAVLLQKNDKVEQQALKEKIAAGDPFICPAHKCAVCKHTENEKIEDMQFAICRRCPTSYHRKCLPRKIVFDEDAGDDDEIRAWDGLLPKSRVLIFCLKHEIDPDLCTPARTLIFRNILTSKTKRPSEQIRKIKVASVKETGATLENSLKKKKCAAEISSAKKPEGSFKRKATVLSGGPDSVKKKKVADTSSKNPLKRNLSTNNKKPVFNDNQPTIGSRLYDLLYTGTESKNLEKDGTSVDNKKQVVAPNYLEKDILPPVDDDSKQRILALMKDAASSITLEDIKEYHLRKVPSTHAHSSRVDKSIRLARVEGSVEALNVALKKLEEGCSVEDAMAVCEPADIAQLLKWKEKLRVYLAPFLHGMRYTSYGRHFTKVDKLEEIADKLQWYIKDGDTVVDFCCGANDFSCLVKKRLDEMGKTKCSYKNYDIKIPKNDFCFEKRNWMMVNPKELPSGSQLIMGLNPPFGVNAALANQFIDKALQFKPKLIVLIVPPETERLDSEKKRVPYDLMWEDAELLSGKSFYLPGSCDVNDKQMEQWNNTPPPLYLWSRSDWTSKHKAIAQQHGHIPVTKKEQQQSDEKNVTAPVVTNAAVNNNDHPVGPPVIDLPTVKKDPEQTKEKAKKPNNRNRKRKGKAAHSNDGAKNKPMSKEEEKPNQNSNKRNRLQQLDKRDQEADEKDDHKKPRSEDQAQKNVKVQANSRDDQVLNKDNTRAPRDDQAPNKDKDKTRSPRDDHALNNDKTRAPREDQALNKDKTRAPRDDQALNKDKTRSHRDDQALKQDKSRAPRDDQAQNHDKTRSPRDDEALNKDKTRSPRDDQALKQDKSRAPRDDQAQNHVKTRSPRDDEALNKDKTRSPRDDQALKHDKTRAPRDDQAMNMNNDKNRAPRDDQPLKPEKTQAPRDDQTLKPEKTRAPRDDQALNNDKTRAPSHDDQVLKPEKIRAPSRDDQALKPEKTRASSRDDQALNHDKIRAPSRDDQPVKLEKVQASPREYHGQKLERSQASPHEYRAPSHEIEARKHDFKYNSSATVREDQPQKVDNTYNRARENDMLKLESKYNTGSARVDQVHETRDADFSFLNDVREQLADQNLEMRYDDESTFSLQNDVAPSFDHYLERKYNPNAEDPYLSSSYNRRVDGPSHHHHANSSYSIRPDPVQYSGYDRGTRGSYYDEMSSRGGNGNYPVTHHEPGLTRYGPADTTPYNRASASAMQKYAPRLDELNPRMNNVGRSEMDGLSHTRMNGYGRPEPPMGGRGVGGYGPPLHGPGYRMDGFAPGPYNPYSQHNSGGWLNE